MKHLLILVVVFAMIGAACGGGEDDAANDQSTEIDDPTDNGSGNGGSDSDGGENTDDPDSGNGAGDDGGDSTDPDDEDFGDLIGNPDLDLEDLGGQAGDLADSIDDIVSIGDCVAVGLMATAPEGWSCRVLDNPTPTFDGFTMFTEGNDLNITVGTPSPLGAPCELLQVCDEVTPIALSDNFPDTTLLEFVGTVTIYGTHASGAVLVITKASALTPEETQLIMDVLDSVQPA